jgi:hypothetical protein
MRSPAPAPPRGPDSGVPRGPDIGVYRALLVCGIALSAAAAGCFRHAETPLAPPSGALAGRAPAGFDRSIACGRWSDAVGSGGGDAMIHASFPETQPAACFVPVRHDGERALPDPIPPGCGYPTSAALPRLEAERARYERIAAGEAVADLPLDLACSLPAAARAGAARQNARALARVARDVAEGRLYPYSAVAVFGFGHRDQGASVLLGHTPGEPCRPMSKADLDLLTINVTRAGRGALAHAGRVAPVVITSGGAVHSPLIEAFALAHLASCRFGVPADRILVDPCADHTHTNIKHVGGLVVALGGRTAYIVTDDGLQSEYLEDWTFWRFIGGDLDQRSLRDWGYLLGSWRRASAGMRAGFWFTPYRFWGEPAAGLGSFTCTGR